MRWHRGGSKAGKEMVGEVRRGGNWDEDRQTGSERIQQIETCRRNCSTFIRNTLQFSMISSVDTRTEIARRIIRRTASSFRRALVVPGSR